MENFTPIREFDGYFISIDGKVSNGKIILKTAINNKGYEFVRLRKNGIVKTKTIHSLLAVTFLNGGAPIRAGYEVKHKNGDKLDNRIENLEIAKRTKREVDGSKISDKVSKPLKAIDGKTNEVIGIFKNTLEAEEKLNKISTKRIYATNITKVLKGKLKSHGGYKFEYVNK